MKRSFWCLFSIALFAWAVPVAAQAPDPPDPTEAHRWHMPRRGARDLARDVFGPIHAEWNYLGHWVNAGKDQLGDWGIRFDVDLAAFEQHASRVATGQHNYGTFSWRIMGDGELFDLTDDRASSALAAVGKGFLGWTAFGTVGFDYDASDETLTGNVGAVDTLNATVFDQGAALDELFWKQVALDGKLVVLAGKVDQVYHFDTNRVANDGYSEFFSYSLQNNPSIPAPVYGGFGGIIRVNPTENVYVMVGSGDSSMDRAKLPWQTLDNDSWYQLLELGLSGELPVLGKGNYRITPWHNHFFGSDGFGIALNVDQELGRKDVVAFFRFGHGDKDVTPVETFVSGGIALEEPFGRDGDLLAVGVAWSDPSPSAGSRDETLIELMYRVHLAKAISLTPNLQLVIDPAANRSDDFVAVGGVRLLLHF